MVLYAPSNKFSDVKEKFKDSKYNLIKTKIVDNEYKGHPETILNEQIIFNFDNNILQTKNELAWYAGNKTEELRKILTDKIELITSDSKITTLLKELNTL